MYYFNKRLEGITLDNLKEGRPLRLNVPEDIFSNGFGTPSGKIEFVAGYDSLDADNYEEAWNRTALGVNYFFNQHKTKVQATWRMSENALGIAGEDINTGFVQFQFVF